MFFLSKCWPFLWVVVFGYCQNILTSLKSSAALGKLYLHPLYQMLPRQQKGANFGGWVGGRTPMGKKHKQEGGGVQHKKEGNGNVKYGRGKGITTGRIKRQIPRGTTSIGDVRGSTAVGRAGRVGTALGRRKGRASRGRENDAGDPALYHAAIS